jgi:transcriptional regulator with XRE-family HTH domain
VTTSVRNGAPARRAELREFLMSRRARISPAETGLAPGPRRRTPGLRREEVAVLAGVGVSWYQWLEQGRDITVSPQVLDAITRTLRLDEAERRHLYVLLGDDERDSVAV